MQIWMNIVLVIQLVSALAMIGLVLVQHGKGADMGASFGSGSAGSLFGASGSANFLSRSTAVLASVFFVCTLALAYMGNTRALAPSDAQRSSVLERAAPAASEPAAAAQIPGAVAPPAPAPAPAAGAGSAAIPTN